MVDFAGNPYLMQPEPDRLAMIANLLLGAGAGISQAGASGRGWASGIAPGLMMGANMTARDQQQAWQRQQQAGQYQMMLDHRRTQDEATREKTAMARQEAERTAGLGSAIQTALGFNVQPNQIQMGPQQAGDPASVIGGMESGGRYDAVGPDTGRGRAYGKYQVMDFNVGPWTKEVLGAEMTPPQFAANPQAQDAVFKAKFGQYRQQYGSDDAAARAWFAEPGGMNNPNARDMLGTSVADYSRKFNRGTGGPTVAQAGGPIPQGDASGVPQSQIDQLDPSVRAVIAATAAKDPKAAATMLMEALKGVKKEDAWYPVGADDAKMYPGLDQSKAYQRNRVTGEIKQVGGGGQTVNIDQKGQSEFSKKMGAMDAERFGEIIKSEGTLNDMASKVGFALDQLRQTYTGPAGETANAFFGLLAAAGVEGAKDKKNAADAGMAVISQMKPYMRASGSGASSDKDMDMFARALPSLLNMPGGNERIGLYFQRLADRATAIRQLAQEHWEGGKVPLTGTGFDDAVKKLGPLFNEEERKEMSGLNKAQPTNRPPLDTFGTKLQMTPAPSGSIQPRPQIDSFGGGR